MTTVLPVLVLALLDSVNPSALVVTLTLLSRGSRLRAVLVYVAGIFATYLTLGVLLVLGLGSLIDALGGALESPAAGVVGAVIGGGLLLYAVLAPNPKDGGGAGRERASARLVERLRRGARETTLWIYGLVGFYLLANGLSLAGVI